MNLKPEAVHEPRACKSLNSSSLLGMFAFAAFPCSLTLTSVLLKPGTHQIWLASGLVGSSLPSLSPTNLQCPSWEATLKWPSFKGTCLAIFTGYRCGFHRRSCGASLWFHMPFAFPVPQHDGSPPARSSQSQSAVSNKVQPDHLDP